jgi:uncharacterized protein
MRKFNFKIVLFITIVILLGISYYGFSRYSGDTVDINGHTFKIEIAQSLEAKKFGLLGRESIADDEAMLFIFSDKKIRSFWMKDMNFNIDLLWIDNNTIIGLEKNMQALDYTGMGYDLPRYTSLQPIDKVLEIKSGSIENLDIKIGDTIEFESKKFES